MTQSGTLGIFSSREQEYEQKAQLLKRLAYVIFCSEIDQYAKYMPEIQGNFANNKAGRPLRAFSCEKKRMLQNDSGKLLRCANYPKWIGFETEKLSRLANLSHPQDSDAIHCRLAFGNFSVSAKIKYSLLY